jgi:hypothetical protein
VQFSGQGLESEIQMKTHSWPGPVFYFKIIFTLKTSGPTEKLVHGSSLSKVPKKKVAAWGVFFLKGTAALVIEHSLV